MAKRNASGSAGSRPKSSGSQGRPNILVIWGDDIGITNLSCYSVLADMKVDWNTVFPG